MKMLTNPNCLWLISFFFIISLIVLGILSILLINTSSNLGHRGAQATSSPQRETTSSKKLQGWIIDFEKDAQNIVSSLTHGNESGKGWDWLAYIADTYGNRQEGSKALNDTIDYITNYTRHQGFDNVRAEPVIGIRNWIRGEETATLLNPRIKNLSILGIGNTVATPPGGITADVIVFENFSQMDAAGVQKIQGKIVVFNEAWIGSYGSIVSYRTQGAKRASKYGAVAVLIRSVTSFSVYSPHTGAGSYDSTIKPIPMACLTVEDAMLLHRFQKRGIVPRIHLNITSHSDPATLTSANTIFELKGSVYPEKIIAIGGHLDSWDVGQGAMDDGGGCAVMWQAMTALLNLGLRPKRTIRAVFFTAEENGFNGARQYYQQHMNESHVFAAESDEGVFKPTSLNAALLFKGGSNTTGGHLQDIAYLIQSLGIPVSARHTESDVGEMEYWPAYANSTGAFYYNQDAYDKYFTFHHTNADTMTIYKPEDLDYTSAIMAVYVHVIANMDQEL